MTVLVTGASGVLGSAVMAELRRRSIAARGAGRRSAPEGFADAWATADLLNGSGLDRALSGVSTVIHCASNPLRPNEDVRAMNTLIEAAKPAGVHLVYVGIAGIEKAAKTYAYYRAKLECERKLVDSGALFSIVRTTQFHPFVAFLLRCMTVGPFLLTPRMTLQPIDISFVASRLADYSSAPPPGRVSDLHGPEALDARSLIRSWSKARGVRKLCLPVPGIGPLAALQRLMPAKGASGGRTWTDWCAAEAAGRTAYERRLAESSAK